MKQYLSIIVLGCLLQKKESNWIGWNEKNKGYSEEQIASDRWLLKYHVNDFTKDADILKLLYRRVDEFGNQVCSKGFETNSQSITLDYTPLGGDPIGKVGSIVLVCKN